MLHDNCAKWKLKMHAGLYSAHCWFYSVGFRFRFGYPFFWAIAYKLLARYNPGPCPYGHLWQLHLVSVCANYIGAARYFLTNINFFSMSKGVFFTLSYNGHKIYYNVHDFTDKDGSCFHPVLNSYDQSSFKALTS